MYYGVDYYPEHWPQERWERDAELMRAAGINVVRMAEFAWSVLEPVEGQYDFAWLDEAIEGLARQGIATILCTPTATPPAWMCQRYPDIMRVTRDGQRVAFGMRRQYCATSATYRRLSAGIVAAMAQHYADNPNVIGWQLDNEFGCHDTTRCYCPECQTAFQAWARGRYGNLNALNDAWGTRFWSHVYSSWSQIPLPWAACATSNPCLELDYHRFASDQMIAYAKAQTAILRARCPGQTVTTNLMGLGFRDIDYFALAEGLDWVCWDNYPMLVNQDAATTSLSHDMMRGLKRQPFWVMEQQAGPSGWEAMSRAPKPGQLRLWAYQAISHGADAIVYFRWRTCPYNTEEYWHGVLDHDGTPRRRYREIAAMGAEVAALGDRIVGTGSPKAVALMLSYDDSWSYKLQPNAPGLEYGALLLETYWALNRLGVPVDIVSPDGDLAPYPVVIAPTLHLVTDDVAERLGGYVRGGGHLVVGARSGVKDASNRVVTTALPGLLRELCGVEVDEYDALGTAGHNAVRFESAPPESEPLAVHTWCDILVPTDAEVVARYADDFYAGEAAITRRIVGAGSAPHRAAGSATYVGAFGGEAFQMALARWVCEVCGVAPLLDAPEGVEVVAREGEAGRLLFLLNHSEKEQRVALDEGYVDLITGEARAGEAVLAGYGVMILAKA